VKNKILSVHPSNRKVTLSPQDGRRPGGVRKNKKRWFLTVGWVYKKKKSHRGGLKVATKGRAEK